MKKNNILHTLKRVILSLKKNVLSCSIHLRNELHGVLERSNKILPILLLILISAILWIIFLPGPRVANDFPLASQGGVKLGFNLPQTWHSRGSGFGEYGVSTLWAWPVDFLYGMGAQLGINFSVLERIIGILPIFIVGVWGMTKLFDHSEIKGWGKYIGILFYLLNTYILLLIDGGQISIALAYAWFPISYLAVLKGISGNLKAKIIAGLSIGILGFLDIRFIYILLILLAIHFLYEFIFDNTKRSLPVIIKWVVTALVTGIILAGLNFYWILPAIISKAPALPATYTRVSQTGFLNTTELKHAISILQPQWYLNVFGKVPPFRKEFLLIPILAFLAPILKRKDKRVWFWTLIAIVSVFLTKGANPPLPGVYTWLFTHVPGFSLFRDSTKFFFLVALSYSVLIAFTVEEITKRFSKLKIIFPLLIILYLLFLIRPVYLGQMTGTFSEPRYETEYLSLANKIETDMNFGRIFWIPSQTPLGYSSPTHPSVEASRLESLRPFEIATVGTYETQNFVREGSYMGELFDIAGIKYVAYPYLDPKRDDMSQGKVDYYNTFLGQIGNLPWIGQKISDSPVPVFETKKSEDRFFLSKNTYFVVGSDSIYQNIYSLGAKFSDNALVFAEENPELLNQIEKVSQAKIILYDKTITDLLISLTDKSKFIFPGSKLDFSPSTGSGSSSWWKRETSDLVWWRDFLQQKYGIDNLDFDYGGGWAISEGTHELTISNKEFTNGKTLFARIMQSSRGGEIGFYQGNKLIGNINTKIKKTEKVTIKLTGSGGVPDNYFTYDKADFSWIRIGSLVSDGEVTIKTNGDINVVNSLVILSQDEENSLKDEVNSLESTGKIVDWKKLDTQSKKDLFAGENPATVSYTAITPTHYKIKITGLTSAATLFFSETYDNGWQLGSQSSYPLYSLINGFTLTKDGEYDLYFTPQKYVLPGLVVSGITLTSCIMLLVWKRLKRSS